MVIYVILIQRSLSCVIENKHDNDTKLNLLLKKKALNFHSIILMFKSKFKLKLNTQLLHFLLQHFPSRSAVYAFL